VQISSNGHHAHLVLISSRVRLTSDPSVPTGRLQRFLATVTSNGSHPNPCNRLAKYANVTDKTDRTGRQRSDSIGRTVL